MSPSVETFTAPTGPYISTTFHVLCFDFPGDLQPWEYKVKFPKHEDWGMRVGEHLDGEKFRQHPQEMSSSIKITIADMVGSHCVACTFSDSPNMY